MHTLSFLPVKSTRYHNPFQCGNFATTIIAHGSYHMRNKSRRVLKVQLVLISSDTHWPWQYDKKITRVLESARVRAVVFP